MKINTREDQLGWNGQFISGREYGFDKSVKIHCTANLIGDIEIGENTRIDGNVTISGNVKIARNCHIATGANLFGANGITIGDHCGISAGCQLFTGTDDPDSGRLALHAENELSRSARTGPINIADYVTIGANSVVMPNVSIGAGVMVGSLSFVKHPLSAGYIYGGNPIRMIRERPPLEYPK